MLNTSILTKSPSLFIVSSGRSGTTLLNSILNASQQIHIPYESDFIARAFPFYQGRQQLNEADYIKLIDMFMQSSRPRGWGMKEDYLLDYLIESQPQTFAEVDSALSGAYHLQQGTTNCLWGIKAPVLIASIDRIMQVYPEAKILHIVRDGRDVCLSYQQVHAQSEVKFGPKSLLANALYWLDGLKRIEEYKSSQIYEFRYEDLLVNPDVELQQICQFIGIKYDESMHQNFDSPQHNSLKKNDHL
ncbi:MAG: sulfotransferase, partial [Cyanobacteria bacterium J06631_2]